jgi:dipeptidyl aminopeptidase/acylaminoacyl peptidase
MLTRSTLFCLLSASCFALPAGALAADALPALADLFADWAYEDVQISPDGKFIGVIVPTDGQRELVTLLSDKSAIVARFAFRQSNESVAEFAWLKDNHLLLSPAVMHGWQDQPVSHGELFAATGDGKDFKAIYGYRAGEKQTGSHIRKGKPTYGWGELLSDLPNDPDNILISSQPWSSGANSTPSVLKVRLRDGVSTREMVAPRRNARFLASSLGVVRYASALDSKEVEHVYEYLSDEREWREIATNTSIHGAMTPVGVSADNKVAYYLADTDTNSNALYSLDTATGVSTLLYQPETENISHVVTDPYTGELLFAVHASDDSTHVLNPSHRLVRTMQLLYKAFPGSTVALTSVTRDYRKAIVHVSSDRDPGVWYSYDEDSKQANLELEALPKIDPAQMVAMTRIAFRARDGLELHGFYTAKQRSDGEKPPMVVLVHGGPHARDSWEFNREVQLLATRGYAVLQVNFRGSTGFGRDFERAGRGQWGRAMQDDLTDGTRWVIDQGKADPERICIMGSSYGGYASLMGLIREPDLYQCGIDMFGPTDLEAKFSKGDIPDLLYGPAYLESQLGSDPKEWAARSPAKNAEQIRAPVLIIAGGADKRVPMFHSTTMEKALKRAGKPVETLFIKTEGHGFFELEHRVDAYQKVLDFLARNIGNADAG